MLPKPSTARRPAASCARRCERGCCNFIIYFPLAFIYSTTTWAIWVLVSMAMLPEKSFGGISAFLGVSLYILLNWSYTTAVFTDPGSPMNTDVHMEDVQALTVKHNGEMRFCNKCNARKPDRSHHCSSCGRCVLKMDHHCPWLATCVGLRNYKAFVLFLVYISLFSWLCFAVSATWMYSQLLLDTSFDGTSYMPINFVILSVISGMIGLVISAFTAYHIYLATRNLTTIENIEKTRYLSPLRNHATQRIAERRSYDANTTHSLGEQLRDLGNTLTEIHANALPGVLRAEEGELQNSHTHAHSQSAAHASLRHNLDAQSLREHAQYEEYLDQRDSARLPNAFNLGWRRNLRALFGPSLMLAWLPVCNSIGDGWRWELNAEFKAERERIRREREWEAEQRLRQMGGVTTAPSAPPMGRRRMSPSKGRDESDEEEDDEFEEDSSKRLLRNGENWNDVPDDMIISRLGRGR
jgi:ribosomal protein L40E